MSRRARLAAILTLHHVMVRGIERPMIVKEVAGRISDLLHSALSLLGALTSKSLQVDYL